MEDLTTALDVIHLMATMEAVALTRACKIRFDELHEILVGAAGNSGAFEQEVSTNHLTASHHNLNA